MRWLRYGYRVPLLLWHLLIDLPLAMLLVTRLTAGIQIGGERFDYRVIRLWSAGMMRVFGFRLRRVGTPSPGSTLFVANHVSWIDILALHSQRTMGLVAKREIASWPVIGWVATRGETLWHQRGDSESMGGVLQQMLQRLRSGHSVGVFPEGRTRDGHALGPFHARTFLAAVEANVPVQPVALRYGVGGNAQAIVAFRPGENFMANFIRLLGEPGRIADICFLEPIPAGSAEGRRRIAGLARDRIAEAMAQG